jgi:hypothetical protein
MFYKVPGVCLSQVRWYVELPQRFRSLERHSQTESHFATDFQSVFVPSPSWAQDQILVIVRHVRYRPYEGPSLKRGRMSFRRVIQGYYISCQVENTIHSLCYYSV